MANILSFFRKDRDNNIKLNIIFSFIFKFLGLGLSFLLVPLTIGYLNNEQYGIWLTLLSIISWVSFSDIGLGNGLRNKLTESLSKNDIKSSREYISTAYAAMFIIVSILLIVLILIIPFLNWQGIFNTKSISNSKLINLIIVVLIFFLGNFILSLYNQLYYAKQQASITGIGQLFINLISIINLLILRKISNGSIIYLGFSYGLSLIIPSIFLTYLFFVNNKELKPAFKYIKLNKFKDIIGLGIKFFIIQIACVIYFSTNNLIIAQVCGPSEVTNYNIVFKYFSIITMGHMLLITPLWSAYTEAFAKGDIQWIKNMLKKMSILLIPIAICLVLMTALSNTVFKIWLGNNSFKINNSLVITIAISTFISVWSNVYVYFLNGLNELNLQMYNSIIVSIINIPLCIYFSKNLALGSTGVMIGQIISSIPFSIIITIKAYSFLKKKGAS